MSELLVLKVFLQLCFHDTAQLLKVLVVQAAVSHQLNALRTKDRSGQKLGC